MQPPDVPDAMALLRTNRGQLSKIARGLGVTRSVVVRWDRVPAERLPEVERITGIPRWVLRPDICRPPDAADDVLRLLNTWPKRAA
jgi:DNA-binding transcriptional regulator YdaS (Cro superfamily)